MSNEALAIAIQQGDSDALAQLWEQVKDYAYTVVMRYTTKPYADTEDYLQTAFLGVRAAALAFDPNRGSFLTVADWYIRNACNAFYRWNRHREIETISYDVPMNADDPDGGDFRDNFPDDSIEDPTENLARADIVRDVRAAVNELRPRQQDIIEQHYYLGVPLDAVSKAQGISRERVRQLEQGALKQLRNSEFIAPYRREYAPVKGVGVSAFRKYGQSVVEYVALKNIEKAKRAELRAFEKHVMHSIEQGYYSPEIGQMIIAHYKAQQGIP